MFTLCWAAKGGSGTTVVAAGLALASRRDHLLVDLAGDLPLVLGLGGTDALGVTDWVRSTADVGRLTGLEIGVDATTSLLPMGATGSPGPADERWADLGAALATDGRDVVVDAGSRALPPPSLLGLADRRLLVTRPCYLSVLAASRSRFDPTGVVLIDEPGRALGAADVAQAIGAPIVAELLLDPAVAPRRRLRIAGLPTADGVSAAPRAGGMTASHDHRRARSHDRGLDAIVDDVCRRAGGVRGEVRAVVEAQTDRAAPLATPQERRLIVERAVARLDGLDVLDELLRDDAVDEVIVNRGQEVLVDRNGRLERVADLPTGAIDVVLERVLAPIGRRLDRTTPIVDARLADGSRLCAVVAPIAVDGTSVAIRRHRTRPIDITEFADRSVARTLTSLIESRANILITGATSSGKTTLLAALCRCLPPEDRLVLIEDTTEIDLGDRHLVRLEARPATSDGPVPIEPAELVRTALRLRPDRLVVGEFRGAEVLAAVQALNTGHDGSLSTCHANGPVDGLRRLETLVLQAAPSWPLAAIRRAVSRSLDAVVHVVRLADGRRMVSEVIEVVESDGEPQGRPVVADGEIVGRFERGRT